MDDPPLPAPIPPRVSLRLVFGADAMLGPGKAELLERIRDTGSIAAAGRQMQMSYKRAWMLVEEMNATFKDPLVGSLRGGPKGGGAWLTDTGAAILSEYRALEAVVLEAGQAQLQALHGMVRDIPAEK